VPGGRNVPLGKVNVGALASDVREAAADTLNVSKGVHDLLLTLNVGVQDTENVLEVVVFDDESLEEGAQDGKEGT
jgi:hypothetical protein